LICLVDFGEGLDQVDGVSFIPAEPGSHGMRVYGDVHDRLSLLWSLFPHPFGRGARVEGAKRSEETKKGRRRPVGPHPNPLPEGERDKILLLAFG
jgi:hypothetical protein